jgi:hypothetical protein
VVETTVRKNTRWQKINLQCRNVVLHVGVLDLPESRSRAASEGDLRLELCTSYARPICFLFGVLCILCSVVESRECDRLSADNGGRIAHQLDVFSTAEFSRNLKQI